ncbi:FAD-dependent thymidylate synthase [Helicobacter saguini]|uniref:FAD-dependent thymidylate synthase n=1 Tax=Helicobacter saguini TaxID=1548018 RepID=A0A6B0HQB7_9HELI|nr:FAD-dependent thymidylate synthase [Helicobacter saguini]MWV62015.1 FAD-dependent thymidylate synthase [Helicobacter saguini]MWV67310.1 FAD-dependent thymidylate synthase [Helicobacter saguini]MWV69663.1 FAD-dependent thymidylate synthase [Helicobacter saguini]MWV73120.1 FAD-dependent thymidylate synthase [Helicobacter saguini]
MTWLLARDLCKAKHIHSLQQYLIYTFDIKGISRACLQELARHRIASLSVKSTRYTLKELAREAESLGQPHILSKYVVISDIKEINMKNTATLEAIQKLLNQKEPQDKVKYLLPESYKTNLVWTINARSLQNFLELRTSKAALKEIQNLAHKIYEALPSEHKYIFKDSIKKV